MVELTADEHGITVRLRGRFAPRAIGSFVKQYSGEPDVLIGCPWTELGRVSAAKRSIVIWQTGGNFCRIAAFHKCEIARLVDLIEAHGKHVEPVRGTVLLGTFTRTANRSDLGDAVPRAPCPA